ncbi:hypothetical protein JTE90_020768 [Oedothorax gibbosus]|uniref:Uncharacterized protein n=1 Tax=Oedothorax gibbosus TaxID=931172 RepID=A0AAV6TRN0_9ARAC|nr:hypothetical protein JTE90_020768 [Oedothorax gibbosus]
MIFISPFETCSVLIWNVKVGKKKVFRASMRCQGASLDLAIFSPRSIKSRIDENPDDPMPIPPILPIATPAPSTSKAKQSTLDFFVEGGKPISKVKADKLDKQLIRLIVKEYNPFSIVEDKEFINFVKLLCPTYKLPSRKTISNGLLNAICNDTVDECRKGLDKVRYISLTTDGWTSINNESFIATTVHFIDEEDGDLKTLLLGCSRFEASHTSVNLGEDLKSKLQLWGLEGKVVCVTTDNASNIVGAIAQCRFRQMGCFAHSLNLIVKSCLQLEDVKKVVSKIKRTVMFFKQSTVALQRLKENQRHMQMPELKLKQDVETRWNSTYDMVDRFVKNKEPILTTLVVLESAPTNFHKDEWELMKGLIAFLEIFHSITVEISTEKHVSISKLPLLYGFMNDHVKMCTNEYKTKALQDVGRILSQQIADRLLKVVTTSHVCEAVLLDPRFKELGLEVIKMDVITKEKVKAKLVDYHNKMIKCNPNSDQKLPSNSQKKSYWDAFDKNVSTKRPSSSAEANAIIEMDKT